VFRLDEALFFERCQQFLRARNLALQCGFGQWARFQRAQDFRGGVGGLSVQPQLAGHVDALLREGPDARVADFRGNRGHRAQYLAERGAVVVGHPAAEFEQVRVEGGLGVEQPEGVASLHGGRLVVHAEDDAGEFALAERHQQAAARLDAVAESFRQPVREAAVQRDRQAHVGKCKICFHA